MLDAARNSLVVASASATPGHDAGMHGRDRRAPLPLPRRGVLLALAGLPLIVPFIVLAVAFFLLFVAVDVQRSLLTVGVGHTVIALPYAMLIVLARLAGLDPALEDAAMDLGATYPTTLRRVVLPLIGAGPAVRLADVLHRLVRRVRAGPLPGRRRSDLPGLPLRPAALRQPLPMLIALAVLLMIGTVGLTLLALRLRGRSE